MLIASFHAGFRRKFEFILIVVSSPGLKPVAFFKFSDN